MTKNSLFEYTDYRAFLRAHAEDRKKANPRWSYSLWAKRLGLAGTAPLTMILNGQRQAGPKLAEKMVHYFEFNARQREYFLDLVNLQKAGSDSSLSVLLMEKLKKNNPQREFKLLDSQTFEAISSWQHYAVREMTQLPDFQEDSNWISERLRVKITPREVSKAIETLERLKLLARNAQNKLRPTQAEIQTTQDVSSEAIKRFHEQTLDLAKASIREVPVSQREVGAVTLTVSSSKIQKAKDLIRKFQDEFTALIEEPSLGDSTYQLNVQFFPLTENKNEGVRK